MSSASNEHKEACCRPATGGIPFGTPAVYIRCPCMIPCCTCYSPCVCEPCTRCPPCCCSPCCPP